MEEPTLKSFCESFNPANLDKELTGFNNPSNSGCINFILTKKIRCFQNLCCIETGLSDFYKMTISALKVQFCELEPRVIRYNDYKKFSNKNFRNILSFKKTEEKFSYNEKVLKSLLKFLLKIPMKMLHLNKDRLGVIIVFL